MGHDGKANQASPLAPNPILKASALKFMATALCCAALLTACAAGPANAEGGMRDDSIDADGGSPASRPGYVAPSQSAVSAASMGEEGGESAAMASTGTAVGQKVQQLRSELSTLEGAVSRQSGQLDSLRTSTKANATDYFTATAGIDAKLQVGTTKGNPILVSQLAEAQTKLDTLSQDVGSYNALSQDVAQSASQAAFLLEAVRATYNLSGAVDEDHVALGGLEDDVNRTVVKIDRLLNMISGDLSRQSTYVATERRNLQTLSLAVDNGEMYGQSLANRPYMMANLPSSGMSGGSASGIAPGTRPLVVIRFDRDNVNYSNAVYQAVSRALDRYPQASFTVMAVSPTGANPAEGALASSDAKRNADGVARTLSQLGVASGHIQLTQASSAGISSTEVRIYVH